MQIFVMWLDLVTYLHHHGHDEKLPWYRGKVFNSFLLIYDLNLVLGLCLTQRTVIRLL